MPSRTPQKIKRLIAPIISAAAVLILFLFFSCEQKGAPKTAPVKTSDNTAAAQTQKPPALPGSPNPFGEKRIIDPKNGKFCRAFYECESGETCDFATGRCEKRLDHPGAKMEIFQFKPLIAAKGDVVLVDGMNLMMSFWDAKESLSIKIGDAKIPRDNIFPGENRIAFVAGSQTNGYITVESDVGAFTYKTESLKETNLGTVKCSGITPDATGKDGANPFESGPHAAGYIDFNGAEYRVYYPASCGGVRRPPIKGKFPLALILQGDGAHYLQYEYLGQFLATWGFISVSARSEDYHYLTGLLRSLLGKDLSARSKHFDGVSTESKAALIAHSRGMARITEMISSDKSLKNSIAATAALGPVVDKIKTAPGMFLMVTASGDIQCAPRMADAIFEAQKPPKWRMLIKGGNHSLFTDHKIWIGMGLDESPSVSRAYQHSIAASITLAVLQHAFYMKEPFKDFIIAPFDNPDLKMENSL